MTPPLPLVSIVFLVYNRRDALLVSLDEMITRSGYPSDRLEVIVVDNASNDDPASAVAEMFPDVRVIKNTVNAGAPAWNLGFAIAKGDYVLILDDDAYLRPGALEAAVKAAEQEDAGLVSFSVVSSFDESHRLNDDWNTGLLSFWGCAALLSAPALEAVEGYDPDIFIWANETELTMRLLDHGFRHLFLPELEAVHMKEAIVEFEPKRYLVNARHHSYIAGKLMQPADAALAVGSILAQALIDTAKEDRAAVGAAKASLAGLIAGLRRRAPVRPAVSSAYRKNFHPFVSPTRFMRTPMQRVQARTGRDPGPERTSRFASFYDVRADFYPTKRGSIQL